MKLRFKILGGFWILAAMLLIASAWSIIEIQSFGSTFQESLENNYKSIYAAQSMKEALEREDSALLLLMMNNNKRGTQILQAADTSFAVNYDIAHSNITINGEEQILISIAEKYSKYKSLWHFVINNQRGENELDWYFQNIHSAFLDVMINIDELTKINDNQLYSTALQINQRSKRALMPGVIGLIAAIIFTVLFNYFINLYIVSPVLEITKRIKNFTEKRTPFNYHIDTKDEISKLTETLNILCTNITAEESD